MVAGHLALVTALAACLAALVPPALAAEPEPQQVSLFLHRDGALSAAPSVAPQPAAWVFGLAGTDEVHFATEAFPEAWTLRAPAVLTFTLALEAGIGGGIAGVLDVAGQPIAAASAPGPWVPGAHDVTITFTDFRATVPAGQRLGLTLLAAPAVDLDAGGVGLGDTPPGTVAVDTGALTGPLGLGGLLESVDPTVGQTVDKVTGLLGLGGLLADLGVPGVRIAPQVPDPGAVAPLQGVLAGAVVYDAATHPARLSLLRELPAPPPVAPPLPAPTPATGGPAPGPPLGGGGAAVPIGPGGSDPGLGAAGAGFDPFLALVGAGTAAIAALSGIVLRRDVYE